MAIIANKFGIALLYELESRVENPKVAKRLERCEKLRFLVVWIALSEEDLCY